MFWTSIGVAILAAIGEATFLQIVPFIIGAFVLYYAIQAKKNKYQSGMVSLAVIMFLVNVSMVEPSTIDLVFWLAYGVSACID